MAGRSKKYAPVVVNFGGLKPQTIQFDPAVKQAFVLCGRPDHMLVIAWDVDERNHGYWRVKVIGNEDGELVTKEFELGKPSAAFYGEIAVTGASHTDLYASYGYEDDDQRDCDGNVVNKPKEVKIHPRRRD